MKALDESPESFARHGAVCVSVDFRNAYVSRFPAGLNDCLAAVKYVLSHKHDLEINDSVVITGCSGGGNLTLATALLAKQQHVKGISGLYVFCPYIAGKRVLVHAIRSLINVYNNNMHI